MKTFLLGRIIKRIIKVNQWFIREFTVVLLNPKIRKKNWWYGSDQIKWAKQLKIVFKYDCSFLKFPLDFEKMVSSEIPAQGFHLEQMFDTFRQTKQAEIFGAVFHYSKSFSLSLLPSVTFIHKWMMNPWVIISWFQLFFLHQRILDFNLSVYL